MYRDQLHTYHSLNTARHQFITSAQCANRDSRIPGRKNERDSGSSSSRALCTQQSSGLTTSCAQTRVEEERRVVVARSW